MRNKREKSKKEKKNSDNLIFWITILGFIIAVVGFFQSSSYKILLIAVLITLCAVCAIVSFFRAIRFDERAKLNDKRIEQLKKEVSEGKFPSDSYFFNKNVNNKGYIIDTLYIKAHILYEASSYDWGVTYTWKAKCHLSNPKKTPKYISCQIAGDYSITDNNILNIKAFIKHNGKKRFMKVEIKNISPKSKKLYLIIPNDFFDFKKSNFTYALSYTWPRSYHPPKDKFSFFIEKESNSKTYETHIKVLGNKQCFSSAFYEIADDKFETKKTKLSISHLKNDENGISLDFGKGTKEKMIYIETSL